MKSNNNNKNNNQMPSDRWTGRKVNVADNGVNDDDDDGDNDGNGDERRPHRLGVGNISFDFREKKREQLW